MSIPSIKTAKSLSPALAATPSVSQQLSLLHHLALDLAVKKLAWAVGHLDEASGDPLVKLALSKGLDAKLPEESVADNRVEVILTAEPVRQGSPQTK